MPKKPIDPSSLPFGAILGPKGDAPSAAEKVSEDPAGRDSIEPPVWDEPEAPTEPTPAASRPAEKTPSEPAFVRMDSKGRVVQWKHFQLSPFQIQSVDAVRQGHNVLVSAPTGAGKTLVAEYAIEDAVQLGKRCIYTSPIKALSSQKYRDFRDDPKVDVGIMTGDVTLNPGAQVLVMTTEILRNAIFENTGLLSGVEYVIFDEIHYMDDRERGTVWEESLIFLPPEVRLICLSATVSNVLELGNWLTEIREQETVIVQEDKRPVPLSHWVWTEESGVFDPSKLNYQRKKAGEHVARAKSKKRSARRGKGPRRGREVKTFQPAPDASLLIKELARKRELPALIFSFSRKDCESLARKAARASAHLELLNPDERQAMQDLQ
ncbi:MAG: DEAD/DEAH box helicase, partial [Planctomycetes bacterium]|nr:DEAD/DEAH box helicase [Planctomycetota bacterium]